MWPAWGAREKTGKKRTSTSYYLLRGERHIVAKAESSHSLQEKRKFSFLGLKSGERGRRKEKVILDMRE